MKIYCLTNIKVLFNFIGDMLMTSFAFSIMNKTPYYSLINSQHPNIKFTMEKESKMLALLDVYFNNKDPCNLLMSVYRKKNFTGLLTNFYSFTSYSYEIGLIRTLVDRAYKINNTLAKFNDDVKKLFDIFKKNQYPEA